MAIIWGAMVFSREMKPLCRPTTVAPLSVVYPIMLENGISLETKYADNVLKIASDVALTPKKSENRNSAHSESIVEL